MPGVRLDDHRAACGERGRRVTARDTEREREVARGEHQHRPDRDLRPPDVRARAHRPRWVGVVDGRAEIGAVAQHLAEQAQLERRALQLALQPRRNRQVRLFVGQLGQLVRGRVERVGDGVQPLRALCGRRFGGRTGGRGGCRQDLLERGGIGCLAHFRYCS